MSCSLPDPPRLPRPLPDPPSEEQPAGQQRRNVPGQHGLVVGADDHRPVQRQHRAHQERAQEAVHDDAEIAALPTPGRFPIAYGSEGPPRPGWFSDPYKGGVRNLRYRDADRWTDFVCTLGLKGPGAITRSPIPDKKK